MQLDHEVLRVFKSVVVPGQKASNPGTIRTDKQTYLEIQCGDGKALSLHEVQQEGRKRMEITEFLRGYRWPSID
jgi:methionyl-tRNA formyltransferase